MVRRAAKKGRGGTIGVVLLLAAVAAAGWWFLGRDNGASTATDKGDDTIAIDAEALREEVREIARDEIAKAIDEVPPPARGGVTVAGKGPRAIERGEREPVDDRALAPHERNPGLAPADDGRAPVRSPEPTPAVANAAEAKNGNGERETPQPEPVAETEPAPAADPKVEARPAAPTAADASLQVLDLTTAANIDRKERAPADVSTSFSQKDAAAVWAYAVVRNDSDLERQITFVWKQDGVERTRADLRVGAKAARWRTWSKKNLLAGSVGHWTIEVTDESGLPLASRTFEVVE